MSGPMGSSAGVGAGVDLKDSDEVEIHLSLIGMMPNYWAFELDKLVHETSAGDWKISHLCWFAGEGVS